MKQLTIFLALILICIPVPVCAEDCIFDETVYKEFIKNYAKENQDARIGAHGETLLVSRNNEEILISGGGCTHLGASIELRTKQEYHGKGFLQKTLELSTEFGGWLINIKALKTAIEKGQYHITDGIYIVDVDAMTVFNASLVKPGVINIDFYIN